MKSINFELPNEPLKLTSYLKKYKKQFWIQTVGGVIYNTIIVAGPVLLGLAIDAATELYDLGVTEERVRNLLFICFAFVLVTVFFQYSRYLKRWYIRNMSNKIANDMRAGLISRTLDLDIEQIDNESVGDLMSRTVGDVDQIVSTVQSTINEAWDTWLLMISYFAVLLYYNPVITLICSIPIPIAIYLAETIRHPLYKYSTNSRKSASLINSHLQNTLNSIVTLRLFGREELENERLKEYSINQMKWNIKTNLLQTGMMPIYSTIASLGVVGAIGFGGNQVINGLWSIGRFTAYLSMFIAMSTRTWVAARVFNQFHSAKAAWDRIKDKLRKTTNPQLELNEELNKTDIKKSNDYIRIENLFFKYPKSKNFILKDINLNVEKGSIVAITGPVGSGKSSLAAALTGLYKYQGHIKIDNKELNTFTRSELVSHIAYFSQDAFLFSSSIGENITFKKNNENLVDNQLEKTIHTTALYEDMTLFEKGIDTIVGEKGKKISGGQRQRIALARTLYTNAPIIILDDPFSAVDIGTEKRMIERLKKDLSGKTIFLFSHRLGAFKNADIIIVLKDGQIEEMGNHDELICYGGIYEKIYNAQNWMEGELND